MKTKHNGLTLISLIAAIAGVIVSFSLLKEDVLSTASTLFEYFPANFGVTPAMTWTGAIYLGVFVSVTQIVTASVASRKELSKTIRYTAGLLLMLSIPFDAWTDIVFRSGNFTGNPIVAIVTTVAFYTFGSELMQSLSWIIVLTSWRQGIRELMWFSAKGIEGIRSISTEWRVVIRNAYNSEQKSVQANNPNVSMPTRQYPSTARPRQTSANEYGMQSASQIPRTAPKPAPSYPPRSFIALEDE
jgi:hypothetical protein